MIHFLFFYLAQSLIQLLFHLTEDTLVAGFSFSEHAFEPGSHQLNSFTSPWNTACVWNLNKLTQIGFLLISEKRK